MKYLKMLIAVCSVLAFITGCSRPIGDNGVVEIDLTEVTRDSIPYSEFVDSITYLNLETVDDCLLANICNIVMADSVMALFDDRTQQVVLFNRDGHFLHKIGGRGQGPGEYIVARNIDFDRDAGHILVYNGYTVHRYTVDDIPAGLDSIGRGTDFAYLGDGKYLVLEYNDDMDKSGIFLVNPGERYSRVKLAGCRYDMSRTVPFDMLRNDSVVSVMTRPFENRLLEWRGDSLMQVLDCSIKHSPTEEDARKLYNSPQDIRHYPYRMIFYNTGRWFYTYFWQEENLRFVFCDRKTGKIDVVPKLVNDIDGVYGVDIPVCLNGSIVKYCSPDDDVSNPRLQFLHVKR